MPRIESIIVFAKKKRRSLVQVQ